jgi:hypothetical protein
MCNITREMPQAAYFTSMYYKITLRKVVHVYMLVYMVTSEQYIRDS